MKSYGKEQSADGSILVVRSDSLDLVVFEIARGWANGTVFLPPKGVAALIEQLQTWLDIYHTGGVT